jgi:hypothetical protein
MVLVRANEKKLERQCAALEETSQSIVKVTKSSETFFLFLLVKLN